jgi:hypothetical protein
MRALTRGRVYQKSFIIQPKRSSLAEDPHKSSYIDKNHQLQAVPNYQIREKIHANIQGKPGKTSSRPPQGQRDPSIVEPSKDTGSERSSFCSLLLSSHFEHYG